jgi:hypothetical protein
MEADMDCANERYFTAAARLKASDGIIDPQPTVIDKGLIFRYGASLENAKTGAWWLDANQYQRVEAWAKANGLAVPLAARFLSGVLHEWGKSSIMKSNMRILVRATVKKPLRAYMGIAKDQDHADKNGRVQETMRPVSASTGFAIVQLFIPGLDQASLDVNTLEYGAPVIYDVGASHIFGVPLVPAGTAIN